MSSARFDLPLIAMLESPGAVLDARDYAKHRDVMGLLVGAEDLATELGATPTPEVLRTPKLLVHYAAKAEGKMSFGLLRSVADYADLAGDRGRRTRGAGAWLRRRDLRPSVVWCPSSTRPSAPSLEETAWAERVVERGQGRRRRLHGRWPHGRRAGDRARAQHSRPLMPSLGFNPYVPRPIDRPTAVPLAPDADLVGAGRSQDLRGARRPADWPAWRAALTRWRTEARAKVGYDDTRYRGRNPSARVMNVAWLWDDLLYDHERGVFTVDR